MPSPSEPPKPRPAPLATPTRRKRRLTWVGTAEHYRWLEWVVRALLILNLFDAVMTTMWIYSGRAVEANPLLADLAHGHPLLFVLVKTALVSLGSLLLWRLRRQPLAVVAIFATFLVYYFLLIYHLEALDLRLIRRFFA